jgi:hypothetical protein
VKRNWILYRDSEYFSRHVVLDAEEGEEIATLLETKSIRKKFDYIVDRILSQQNLYYEEYQKIPGYEDLSEMRLFPGGLNIRFYCKEFSCSTGHFYVVVAKLLAKKKAGKINKQIKSFLTPIENYEYEF